MNVLDLFSGIGGFSLGLERAGMRTIGFCELDPFCQSVLKKHWPNVICYRDVKALTADQILQQNPHGKHPDVICGGFPCQDVSLAGYRAGIEGSRSGLWRAYASIISKIRPRYVIVENVPGLLSLGMGDVLRDLAEIGYDAEWHCISASGIGAPHLRDRIWIIAYPALQQTIAGVESIQAPELSRKLGGVLGRIEFSRMDQPAVCRVDDGISIRLDRHRRCGNSIVPQIAEIIGRAILEAEKS